MPATPPEALAVDVRAARRRFARAAARGAFDDFLSNEVATRMAERLQLVRYTPGRILDAGSGRGRAVPLLAARYPDAEIVAVDAVAPMLADVTADRSIAGRLRRILGRDRVRAVAADLGALPFPAATFGCVWSNLAVSWTHDLPATFAEWARVLEVGGMIFFSCYGPDTLRELRAALTASGERLRAHEFVDMHDLGDMLVAAGFAEPVMDIERLTLTYASVDALAAELRASGQTNTLAARPRGLWTASRWRNVAARWPEPTAPLRVSVEIVYGHAWRAAPRRIADGRSIVRLERPAERGSRL